MSVGNSLIPFLQHNDGNRTLMGSNMQRQALPLDNPDLAFVQTEVEKWIVQESQSSLIFNKSAQIFYVSSKKIILKYSFLNKILKKRYLDKTKILFLKKKCKWKNRIFFIGNSRKSNQNTTIEQFLSVKKKQWLKKGQFISHGISVLKSKMAVGKNLLIGYLGWRGYNFEDAIIINERLRKENVFTSIIFRSFKIFIIEKSAKEV